MLTEEEFNAKKRSC
ncbi:hypothetical protein LWM68_39805 [Niabella sp. W65]|nr:hypothetical protein [Niabella sp. W65]MCH7368343.1 hypothetical protein [Niabella sp. W65]ULT46173.1 hypothetical protein KRR40_11470 [Niabella sp. I65]